MSRETSKFEPDIYFRYRLLPPRISALKGPILTCDSDLHTQNGPIKAPNTTLGHVGVVTLVSTTLYTFR